MPLSGERGTVSQMTSMTRAAAIVVVALALGGALQPSISAQDGSDLSGQWTLNRDLSQFPREIGFSADFLSAAGPVGETGARGGRGRRGGGGGGATILK